VQRSVLLATELIPNCDYAGISMVHRNRTIDTPAATDELVKRGDELQYTLGEGPCLALGHRDKREPGRRGALDEMGAPCGRTTQDS
jgi:hypothetical protein